MHNDPPNLPPPPPSSSLPSPPHYPSHLMSGSAHAGPRCTTGAVYWTGLYPSHSTLQATFSSGTSRRRVPAAPGYSETLALTCREGMEDITGERWERRLSPVSMQRAVIIGTPKRMKAIFFPRAIAFKMLRGRTRAIELCFLGGTSRFLYKQWKVNKNVIIINMEKKTMFVWRQINRVYYNSKGPPPHANE